MSRLDGYVQKNFLELRQLSELRDSLRVLWLMADDEEEERKLSGRIHEITHKINKLCGEDNS